MYVSLGIVVSFLVIVWGFFEMCMLIIDMWWKLSCIGLVIVMIWIMFVFVSCCMCWWVVVLLSLIFWVILV